MTSTETQTYLIHQQAVEAITRSPHLQQRRLSLKTHGERVILRGQVASYFEKQMAQEVLRSIPGICRIENQLEVCWSNPVGS